MTSRLAKTVSAAWAVAMSSKCESLLRASAPHHHGIALHTIHALVPLSSLFPQQRVTPIAVALSRGHCFATDSDAAWRMGRQIAEPRACLQGRAHPAAETQRSSHKAAPRLLGRAGWGTLSRRKAGGAGLGPQHTGTVDSARDTSPGTLGRRRRCLQGFCWDSILPHIV
jgi:hypothetical protein